MRETNPELEIHSDNWKREVRRGEKHGVSCTLTCLLLFLILLSLSLSACSEKATPEPVVVHVFRDRAAGEVNSALLALGAKQLRTSDGRPIMIATTEVNYADGLEILGRQDRPDLIILNSADDAPVDQRDSLVPVESTTRKYFVGVTTRSQGEEETAAKVVLSAMRAYLEPRKH